MATSQRLTRSEHDRLLVGVCGGLGEHFGIDATFVRIVFVLLAVFGGSGFVLYLALWLIVPRASRIDSRPRETFGDGLVEVKNLAQDGARAAGRGYRRLRGEGESGRSSRPEDPGPGPRPNDS